MGDHNLEDYGRNTSVAWRQAGKGARISYLYNLNYTGT